MLCRYVVKAFAFCYPGFAFQKNVPSSLYCKNGNVIGSCLVGQSFTLFFVLFL